MTYNAITDSSNPFAKDGLSREYKALLAAANWMSLRIRLFEKVDRTGGPGACWPFTGSTNANGYGSIWSRDARRPVLAHRAMWTVALGPVPDGLHVLHRCDNPPCCNPAHLFLGSPADNALDRAAKGRTFNGRKTQCVRGHAYDDSNTYVDREGRRRCRACWRSRRKR